MLPLPLGFYLALTSNKFDIKHTGTWLSWIIQKCTKSPWNHAVLILVLGKITLVIHAQAWIRLELYDDWCQKTDRTVGVYRILAPVDKFWLFRQINKLYDVWGLICQGLLLLTGKWYGRKGGKNDKNFFCSELGVRWLGVPDAHLYKPSDIPGLVDLDYIEYTGLYKTKKGTPELVLLVDNTLKVA